MKKIWFAVLFFLSTVMLAGCQENPSQTTGPSFNLQVIGLDQTVLVDRNIIFNEDDETPIVTLIDDAVGLDYTTYDIGVFVNGVGGHYPTEYGVTYNYYYQLYVDDVVSTIGLSDLVPTDGMKVAFVETTMLDETDVAVDQLIHSFLESQVNTYLSNAGVSSDVLAAIKLLNMHGYTTPQLSALHTQTENFLFETNTINSAFKTAVNQKAFDLNSDTTLTALSSMTPDISYDAVTLLSALSLLEGSQTQIESLIQMITSSTPDYMDADYAGMVIRALAPYGEVSGVSDTVSAMITYIQGHLTSDGAESWGNPNAASTASVIIGLVAEGINPRSEAYTTDGVDLIQALLSYQIGDAFKWLKNDTAADMAFSTPQAFASLVVYKIFRDIYGNPAVNLYDF